MRDTISVKQQSTLDLDTIYVCVINEVCLPPVTYLVQ